MSRTTISESGVKGRCSSSSGPVTVSVGSKSKLSLNSREIGVGKSAGRNGYITSYAISYAVNPWGI